MNKKNDIKVKKLIFGKYLDSWKGCSDLINDIYKHYTNVHNAYKKLKTLDKSLSDEKIKKFLSYKLTNKTKINPAFYFLFKSALNLIEGQKIEKESSWKKLENSWKDKNKKIKDINGNSWLNVNSIYPNYENKGTIALYGIDANYLFKGNIMMKKNKSFYDYSAEISNVLMMLEKFVSKDSLKLNPLEHRAIKYIAVEIINNAFQHAFEKEGLCSIGIFLSNKDKKLIMTINDSGMTIPTSVRNHNKKIKSDSKAIEWALGKGNTTKNKKLQGGLGLFRVKEIIEKANGEFAFRSLNGVCHFKNGIIKTTKNFYSIRGTIFYSEFFLSKLKKESLSISEKLWNEVKGAF